MKKTLMFEIPKNKWVEFNDFCTDNRIVIITSVFKEGGIFEDDRYQCIIRLQNSDHFTAEEVVTVTAEEKEKLILEKYSKYQKEIVK